ncbi:MAG: ABC transporter ATP-binding protein, partial [Planctomycetes bacterium]|nr:ABC transporter ATP-binding protein [Planctomycetota bacterium]
LSAKEQGELRRIGERIQTSEKKLAELSARASDPKIASDADALHAACTALAKCQSDLDGLYVRWEELEARSR